MPTNDTASGQGHDDIAFIVPAKNEERRLPRCLMAIQRAAGDAPVLVVDNDSKDRTSAVAMSFGAEIVSNSIGTVARSRNLAAQRVREKYIAFIDADVEIDKEFVVSGLRHLEENSTIGIVTGYIGIPNDASWVTRAWSRGRRNMNETVDIGWSSSMNMLIKRDVFNAAGGFKESLVTFEDVELCSRVRKLGYRILYDGKVRVVHFGEATTLIHLFKKEYWRGLGGCEYLTSSSLPLKDRIRVAQHFVPLVVVILAVMSFSSQYSVLGAGLLVVGSVAIPLFRTVRSLERGASVLESCRQLIVWYVYHAARSAALVRSCISRLVRGLPGSH